MFKINLVNRDWEFIEVLSVNAVPRIGEFIYNRKDKLYYQVDMVTHDIIKRWLLPNKVVISVIVSPTKMTK